MIYTVSVITPVKRYEDNIINCIKTVKAQSYPYVIKHYVIADDLENFDHIIKAEPNLFIIRNNGFGISGARNTGILESNSDILFFLDSDDLWPSDYVLKILNIYSSQPNIGCISAAGYFFESSKFINSLVVPYLPTGVISDLDVAWNAIGCPSGFSYKVTENTKNCRFNNEINSCEDYLFYLELMASKCGNFYKTNETFFLYKKSDTQLSKNQNKKNIHKTISIFSNELSKGNLGSFSFYMKLIIYIGVRHKTSSLFKGGEIWRYFFYSGVIVLLRPRIVIADIMRRIIKNKNREKCQETFYNFYN
jgi:glycosyltransferase involved in cell wall biosynthesis